MDFGEAMHEIHRRDEIIIGNTEMIRWLADQEQKLQARIDGLHYTVFVLVICALVAGFGWLLK